MYALHIVILLTAIMCQISAKFYFYRLQLTVVTPIQNSSLTYECTHDGTIIITGQDNNLYGSIYAVVVNDSQSKCTVDKNVNGSVVVFTVGTCNVSLPVRITVMKEEQKTTEYMVLGGLNVAMYELKCSSVRRGGLDITDSIKIQNIKEMESNQKYQKEVNMTMKILGKENHELKPDTAVTIGEVLQLIIDGNGGFAFMAESCIATDGTPTPTHSKNLIHKGITQDASVISSFLNHTDQHHTGIIASLYAFHFLKINTVSIICNITVCQDDDSSCPFPLHNNSTRRKRSADIKPHTDTKETSFRVIDSYTNPDDKTDDSNTSGSSIGQMSITDSLILFAAFGFARILP